MTPETLLFRQINPQFEQNGVPSRLAFATFGKDSKHLSVDDGDQTTPVQSYDVHTQVLKLKSVGVMAVLVVECVGSDLPVANSPTEANPAHAHIDFAACSHGEVKKKSSTLLGLAVARGWLYQPDA